MVNTTYGEITENGLRKSFGKICNEKKCSFIDLGSGNGNSLIYMNKLHPYLKSIIGIEYVKDRYEKAIHNLQKMFNDAPLYNGGNSYHYDKFHLYNDDFFHPTHIDKINDCTHVYVSNLCFDHDTNNGLKELLGKSPKIKMIVSSQKIMDNSVPTRLEQTWTNDGSGWIYKAKKRGGTKRKKPRIYKTKRR